MGWMSAVHGSWLRKHCRSVYGVLRRNPEARLLMRFAAVASLRASNKAVARARGCGNQSRAYDFIEDGH